MANKTLAELGLSPFNKFLVAYWFTLGALVLDQVMTFWGSWIPAILGNPMTLPDGSQVTLTLASEPIGIGIFVSIAILYSTYLLYQKKRVGALYAISANWLGAMYFLAVIAPAQGVEMPAALVLGYSIVFILVAAGPTLLFPYDYS